jgi:uncharacterized membrane protein YebE (DUF533 family)
MKPELTKSQRRRIRELAGMAYDRELSRALTGLEEQFKRWHSGEITAHDVDDQIHQFHQGPHRRLFTTYTGGTVEFAVAAAIANGIISEAEAGAEMIEILRGGIESARRWSKEENDDPDDSGQG